MKFIAYFVLIAGGLLLSCKGLSQPQKAEMNAEDNLLGETISELGESVLIIFQDSKKNYWYANDGVVKYDGKTLIRYTTKDGLYGNNIRGIQEDHLGNLYFDTGEGINKFDGETIEKLTVSEDTTEGWKLNSTDLWFAGKWNENGVYRWDGTHLYHLKLPKNEIEDEFFRLNPDAVVTPYDVYSIYRDKNEHIWFGTGSIGACRFDGKNFFWVNEREITEIDPGPAMGLRAMLQDPTGDFYFGSNINSKYRISTLNGSSTYLKLPGIDTSSEKKIDDSFICIGIDKEGNIWLVQYKGGVWKYDGKTLTHYPVSDGKEAVTLFSIYSDREGKLWLGSHKNGIFLFDGKQFNRFKP